MKNTLIIGLGNLILGDDAVGPLAVRELEKELYSYKNRVDFRENYSCGIDMLEEMTGYKNVIIIDSLESDSLKTGEYIQFNIEEIDNSKYNRFVTTHGLTLPILWELGRKLDMEMPDNCVIYGIITKKNDYFSENLSEELNSSFNNIINTIKKKALTDLNNCN